LEKEVDMASDLMKAMFGLVKASGTPQKTDEVAGEVRGEVAGEVPGEVRKLLAALESPLTFVETHLMIVMYRSLPAIFPIFSRTVHRTLMLPSWRAKKRIYERAIGEMIGHASRDLFPDFQNCRCGSPHPGAGATAAFEKVMHISAEKIANTVIAAKARAASRPNSFSYFIKEILDQANPSSQSRISRKHALKKIVDRIRSLHVGAHNYTAIDFIEDVKIACAREGVCFDNDLFSELIR
jgi:hypothetical protein